jgi:surface protein
MDVQKGEISLKLINNTSYPQIANILGSVPNLLSPNKNANLYVFDLSTEDYASLSGISIGISNTSNPTVVNYNLTLLSNDIQGVVQALNTLNMGVFQYYGTSVYVSSGYYIYGALNINSTSVSFVSNWNTTNTSAGSSTSNQIKLPLDSLGTYNFTVDWGDGNVDTITAWNDAETIHTYASSGNYTITIDGLIQGWNFNNTGDRNKILSIDSWGSLNLGNSGNNFWGCANLDLSAVSDILDLTGVTDLSDCFNECASLTTINNINSWNVSSVQQMSNMFAYCASFNQSLDSWDVSSVQNMSSMFQNTLLFNGDITSWNTSSVVYMDYMFNGADVFNQNIGSWDVSNVISMIAMLSVMSDFNQDISSWDVSSVDNMSGMFSGSTSFNQNISSWNVSAVTDMSSMFSGATAFNQNISSWDVSSVANMTDFMSGKSSANYSISFLNAIYSTWSTLTLQPNVTADFGTIQYTSSGSAGKAILQGAPNNWTVTDGGLVEILLF